MNPDTITLPRSEYDALVAERDRLREIVEDAEDAAELLAAEARIARDGGASDRSLPAASVLRMIAGESPLRVWREHRGMTLTQLGAAAGIAHGYISEIETRKKPGSIDAWKALAKALGVTVDDLME